MDQEVDYRCLKCTKFLLSAPNLWTKFSKTYLAPHSSWASTFDELPESLVQDETVKIGSNELSECGLSSIFCKECECRLGLKCVDAPPEKSHLIDYVVMRRLKIVPYLAGNQVDFHVETTPGSETTSNLLQASFALSRTIQPTSSSSQTDALPDFLEVVNQQRQSIEPLQNTINQQQKLIETLQETINDLRTDLESLKTRVVALEEFERDDTRVSSEQLERRANGLSGHHTGVTTEVATPRSTVNNVDVLMADVEPATTSNVVVRVVETVELGQTDTQEYLTSFRAKEVDDDDYIPEGEDLSQSQLHDEPQTQAVSRSVERLLTPAKPAPFKATGRGGRREGAGRPRRDRSKSPTRPKDFSSPRRPGRPRRQRSNSPLPELGTPEWEKPGWDPEQYVSPLRAPTGPNIKRRGVSGRPPGQPVSKRARASESAFKARDEEGYILAANGKRDGRSMRRGGRRSDPAPRLNGHTVTLGDELIEDSPVKTNPAVAARHDKLMGKIFPGRYDLKPSDKDKEGELP